MLALILSLFPWLYTIIGFVLGIMCTVFAFVVTNLLKQNKPASKIVKALLVFSFSIAFLSFLYAIAHSGGLFVDWEFLGVPSYDKQGFEDRAVKIIDIGYVQAQSGNIYHFTYQGCSNGCWERVGAITKNEYEHIISSPDDCGTFSFLPFQREDFVTSKVACVTWGEGSAKEAYAIDNIGRVYSWWHGVGGFDRLEILFSPIISGTLSCVFGTILILLLVISGFLKKKIFKHISQTDSLE